MPNYVTNYMKIHGTEEQIREVLSFVQDDEKRVGSFDFNKVFPIPEAVHRDWTPQFPLAAGMYLTALNPETPDYGVPKTTAGELISIVILLNDNSGGYPALISDEDIEKLRENNQLNEMIHMGAEIVDKFKKYGAASTPEWQRLVWGTRANAVDSAITADGDSLIFFTVWNPVPDIMLELSRRFPDIKIEYEWADESMDPEFECLKFENGKLLENITESPREEITMG